MKAFLILEDGTMFEGTGIGSQKEMISEIVYNTSMTGYLEILSNPSYIGQAVAMTYPLIGNCGVCLDDVEEGAYWPDGLIVRELSRMSSNFRSDQGLEQFLKDHGITGIAGIDTRALTKILTKKGTMNGMITTNSDFDMEDVIEQIKQYKVTNVVRNVSRKEKETFVPGDLGTEPVSVSKKVAVIDVGTKNNIVGSLLKRGCGVAVYPHDVKAEDVLADQPDGILISSGPGDPVEYMDIVSEIKKLSEAGIPIFAIGLGHQLMALAHDIGIYKLKHGHRGANYPVKERNTERVCISSQNHGYVVDESGIDPDVATIWFINVNDKTVEGLEYVKKPIKTLQFYPESCVVPQNANYLFDQFMEMMEGME